MDRGHLIFQINLEFMPPLAPEEVQVGGPEERHHHTPQGLHELVMEVPNPTLASVLSWARLVHPSPLIPL